MISMSQNVVSFVEQNISQILSKKYYIHF
jgi:hypothetical protein